MKLITLGAQLEGENFWEGFDVETGNSESIMTANLVVLPAFIEHKPRRLLEAAAYGIPVIASKACGVENIFGIETVEAGDIKTLSEKIKNVLETLTK